MGKKLLLILSLAITFFGFSADLALAQIVPTFPSCVNPQGVLKVSYDNGQHALPGHDGLFGGKDAVYSLGDGNYLQCLCPTDGSGVQTNWWKIDNLTQEQIDLYATDGWIFIPAGTSWGLDGSSYLAKNFSYNCGSQDNSTGIGGGNVLGTQTEAVGSVLGLAATGDSTRILATALLGVLSVSAGTALILIDRNLPSDLEK